MGEKEATEILVWWSKCSLANKPELKVELAGVNADDSLTPGDEAAANVENLRPDTDGPSSLPCTFCGDQLVLVTSTEIQAVRVSC